MFTLTDVLPSAPTTTESRIQAKSVAERWSASNNGASLATGSGGQSTGSSVGKPVGPERARSRILDWEPLRVRRVVSLASGHLPSFGPHSQGGNA